MCGFFGDQENRYRPFVPASETVIERTRLVESTMAGERVPETAWQAFFSSACSAIRFADFERMFLARRAAVTYLAAREAAGMGGSLPLTRDQRSVGVQGFSMG